MTDLVKRLLDADWNSQQRFLGSRIFGEAADRISQQDAELERLRRHIELLQEKDASQCACSIDTPDDVCLFHVRMKAEARKAAFIEAAEMAEKQAPKAVRVFHEEANITPPVLKAAFEILASTLRDKAEETRT